MKTKEELFQSKPVKSFLDELKAATSAKSLTVEEKLEQAYLVQLTREKAIEKVERGDTDWTDEEREEIRRKAKKMAEEAARET